MERVSVPEGIESYFNAEEIEGAKKYIEVFFGKFLLSDELSRAEAVLLALYMLCNQKKADEISRDALRQFTNQKLGIEQGQFSKGVSDLKGADLVSERGEMLSLTFKGLKKLRQMLTTSISPQKAIGQGSPLTVSGEIPSIGTPASVKEAITLLMASEWGRKPRTSKEIMEALETNALYYPRTTIASSLTFMTRSASLRRIRSDDTFAYVLAKRPS